MTCCHWARKHVHEVHEEEIRLEKPCAIGLPVLLMLYAPGQTGAYDFRLYDTDDTGKEIVWAGFTVQ